MYEPHRLLFFHAKLRYNLKRKKWPWGKNEEMKKKQRFFLSSFIMIVKKNK